jgi:GWxTD domain-containing protein
MRGRWAGWTGGLARAVGCAALAAALGASPRAAPTPSLKAWRDGPVQVLLNHEEYERFGALHSDEERQAFIDEFWRRLDAGPARNSSGGSFKATFEARCAVADQKFGSVSWPGWKTLRGRVYVLLGEPTTVRHETGGRKAIGKDVWVYATPGDPQADLEIGFWRCGDGSYRLEPSCEVRINPNSVTFDDERQEYARILRLQYPNASEFVVRHLLNDLLDTLPRSYTAPAPRRTEAASATASAPPPGPADGSSRILSVVPYYFRAQDGSVLTFITMRANDAEASADASPAGRFVAAASFEEADRHGERVPGGSPRAIPLEPVPRPGKSPMFFGRAYLDSGVMYAARYALKDDAKGDIVVKDVVLTVPSLGSGFAASSLVPAERFGPAKDGGGPFQVGSEEIVPKPDAMFRRSELLRLYVQVYGAAIDPERSAPRVDVVFKFQRVVEGVAKKFGKPFSVREAAGGAMGLALPIGDWPPGEYRVNVELRDRVGGERLNVPGAFTILED